MTVRFLARSPKTRRVNFTRNDRSQSHVWEDAWTGRIKLFIKPYRRVPYIWSAFWHSQNHWKLSGRKYLMSVKIIISATEWTISDTKCCSSAQQLRDLHSWSCVNRAHLEGYRRKLSWASLIFSRCPKIIILGTKMMSRCPERTVGTTVQSNSRYSRETL